MSIEPPPGASAIPDPSVKDQAADWLRDLQDPDDKDPKATRSGFVKWLQASPVHVRGLLVVGVFDDLRSPTLAEVEGAGQ